MHAGTIARSLARAKFIDNIWTDAICFVKRPAGYGVRLVSPSNIVSSRGTVILLQQHRVSKPVGVGLAVFGEVWPVPSSDIVNLQLGVSCWS